jgi:hypothetical protein
MWQTVKRVKNLSPLWRMRHSLYPSALLNIER